MGWLENTPASARLALCIGGIAVAALVQYLPQSWQLGALAAGIALCCYGIGASMGTLLKSSDDGWLEAERRQDHYRRQERKVQKLRRIKPTT